MPQRVRSGQKTSRLTALAMYAGLLATPALAQVRPTSAPPAFGVADRTLILAVHGVGAQIYECNPDAGGHDVWAFREPIAALFKDGRSVGRHYAGPAWELTDGGAIGGKLAASAPGATANDVALLKLDVVSRHGGGALGDATLVLRLNTRGGVLKGPCETAGELRAQPYAADYLFLR
jgi:hypothetical protein